MDNLMHDYYHSSLSLSCASHSINRHAALAKALIISAYPAHSNITSEYAAKILVQCS